MSKFAVPALTRSVHLPNGMDVVISALTLGDLAELNNVITGQANDSAEMVFKTYAEKAPVIARALKVAYPDVTEADVIGLDLDSFNVLFLAVLDLSGLKAGKVAEGEASPVVN